MNDARHSLLAAHGLLRFSGADAQAFLHGQLSCDVAALAPLAATYGSYNTPKGRMLATFVLWRAGADYFMQLPRALCAPLRKRLAMYVLRSKVEIVDLGDACGLLGLSGTDAGAAAAAAFGAPAPAPLTLAAFDGGWLLCLDAGRYEVIAAGADLPRLQAALAAHATAADEAAWDLATIRAGIPVVTPATQEAFVPQMANLDLIGGVSYAKGCYPGQEIVARTHYLGRLKQRMARARVAATEAPQPGDGVFSPVFGEQAAGTVVNAAPAAAGAFELLAVIQTSTFSANGLHLGSLAGPKLELLPMPYPVEVTELPGTKPA